MHFKNCIKEKNQLHGQNLRLTNHQVTHNQLNYPVKHQNCKQSFGLSFISKESTMYMYKNILTTRFRWCPILPINNIYFKYTLHYDVIINAVYIFSMNTQIRGDTENLTFTRIPKIQSPMEGRFEGTSPPLQKVPPHDSLWSVTRALTPHQASPVTR